jgi:hypothetical protein
MIEIQEQVTTIMLMRLEEKFLGPPPGAAK